MAPSSKDQADETYAQARKRAWRYLRKGLFFLAICLVIGQIAEVLKFPFSGLVTESASIAGWVGFWRPMELFLYDLPELKQKS